MSVQSIAAETIISPDVYQFAAAPAQDWSILALFQSLNSALTVDRFPANQAPLTLQNPHLAHARTLYSVAGGNVKIDSGIATARVITLTAGAPPLPILCSKIYQTGTTCTDLQVFM